MEPGFFQITLKVFLRRDDDFLILRDRAQGDGDLPGGRISHAEFHKPWPECIRRELREELGPNTRYELNEEPIFLFPHYIRSAGADGLGVAHEARYLDGEIILSEEHDFFEWVSIGSYDPEPFFRDQMRDAVRRYQREYGGTAEE